MKTLRLVFVSLLAVVGTSTIATLSAQGHHHHDKYSPTVYLISVKETDTIYPNNEATMQQTITASNAAIDQTILDYNETHRQGFQQTEKPMFIFSTKDNKFSFAIGGFINLRASYGFNDVVNNIDFVPYDIPIPGNYATKQRIGMDASTSRLFLKAIANSNTLGRVIVFMDADFRGGNAYSYTPRVRSAYVWFKGLTLGRDVTTFCDLSAAPTTIDFQGPNAYNFNFATMIRYEFSLWQNHLKMGVAAELPNVSATYGNGANNLFAAIPQRMPDFPVYAQFAWGENRQSHIRASAVFRNMYAYDLARDKNTSLFGWGVQASGRINVANFLNIFFNGVYGEGITPYIQDLTGSGLDFTPNPLKPTSIQTMPMYGWQAAAQVNITPRLSLSGGYSAVNVQRKNRYYTEDQYKQGQYVFGNVFYHITPRMKVAAEYLYGTRKDMNGVKNHANRVNVMAQYNF
ncbi:MAG: porin [Alistipes sp.]|nr:porin [Alistipes sp.]